jgi:hypothetical protein
VPTGRRGTNCGCPVVAGNGGRGESSCLSVVGDDGTDPPPKRSPRGGGGGGRSGSSFLDMGDMGGIDDVCWRCGSCGSCDMVETGDCSMLDDCCCGLAVLDLALLDRKNEGTLGRALAKRDLPDVLDVRGGGAAAMVDVL